MKLFEKAMQLKDRVKRNADRIYIRAMVAASALMVPVSAQATTTETKSKSLDVTAATNTITSLLDSLLSPLLAIVGAAGTLYCVLLGVKFAKAEEPQDREKAKTHLKNAIIGFVLIFVLIVALKLMMPQFEKWVRNNAY